MSSRIGVPSSWPGTIRSHVEGGGQVVRRGKFGRLVEQFVATVERMGGIIDPAVVAGELQTRIDMVAGQMRVTPQTVLRNYISEDWGTETATAMMNKIRRPDERPGQSEHLALSGGPPASGSGPVIRYAAANGDQQLFSPALDLHQTGEAVSGLGLAIMDMSPALASSASVPTSSRGRGPLWKLSGISFAPGHGRSARAVKGMVKTRLMCRFCARSKPICSSCRRREQVPS